MKRRVCTLLVALALLMGLSVPAYAADTTVESVAARWEGWTVKPPYYDPVYEWLAGIPIYDLTAPTDGCSREDIVRRVKEMVDACLANEGQEYMLEFSFPYTKTTLADAEEADDLWQWAYGAMERLYGYGNNYVTCTTSGNIGTVAATGELTKAYVNVVIIIRYDENYDRVLSQMPDTDDQVELLQALYDYLRENIKYRNGYYGGTISALEEGYAVCEGYASAALDFCRALDIPCLFLTGNNHAWNMVYIDGEWKVLDVTNRRFLVDRIYTNWSFGDDERDLLAADVVLNPPVSEPSGQQATPSQPENSQTGFADVVPGSYYEPAVDWAVEEAITAGTSARIFSPEQTCSRGEIITFLWRAAGSPQPQGSNPFSDVEADAFYTQAAVWAYEQGMTDGRSFFDPNAPCTRAMAVEIIWKMLGCPDPNGSVRFSDVSSGSSYTQAVAWAVGADVTNGTSDTTFSPYVTCTRAQIVTFLYRAMA